MMLILFYFKKAFISYLEPNLVANSLMDLPITSASLQMKERATTLLGLVV
jgi:hypothetical protein